MLPLGAKLLGGSRATFRLEPGPVPRKMEIRYRGGVEIVPLREPLRSGERSQRLRILDDRLDGNTYVARLEGRRGKTYRLRVLDGEPREIEVAIPDGPGEWGALEMRFPVRQ